MNKRGLSTVITTLIIVLLVLIAVGIVWVVIRNIIEQGTEDIDLGKFTINLQVKQVSVNPANIGVTVKRNPGKGELTGIKFLVSDGVQTQEFEETTTMGELVEQTFTLNYAGLVKEVSIAPILETDSGNEILGNVIDKETFQEEEVVENINGLISWWDFNGDANDEIGGNNGVLNGGVDCNVAGRYDKGCYFDGIDDYINAGNDASLDITNEVSISVWIKAENFDNWDGIVVKTANGAINDGYGIYWASNTMRFFVTLYSANSATNSFSADNTWHHIVGVYDQTNLRIYIDGVEGTSDSYTGSITSTTAPLVIGRLYQGSSSYSFTGTIDEPMIFNRALSAEEVIALYNLDLS
jgi:hypothetical protein